jgi:hypothetical protein
MREDAADAAKIQAEEAATIVALVRDGFTPESAIAAVQNRDWGRLKHTGYMSVQLVPPATGTLPSGQNGQSNGKPPVPVSSP